MRRRWVLGMGGVASLGLVVVLFVWLTFPRPGITSANFQRLRRGMTEQEVTAVLGEPAHHGARTTDRRHAYWIGERVAIGLTFDTSFAGMAVTDGALSDLDTGRTEKLRADRQDDFFDRLCRLLPW